MKTAVTIKYLIRDKYLSRKLLDSSSPSADNSVADTEVWQLLLRCTAWWLL